MKNKNNKSRNIQEKIKLGKIKEKKHVHKLIVGNFKFYTEDYFIKGIYFLYNKGEIVYVGMSETNVFSRVLSHYNENSKCFDSFSVRNYESTSKLELLDIEASLIKKYSPIYNIMHNGINMDNAIIESPKSN